MTEYRYCVFFSPYRPRLPGAGQEEIGIDVGPWDFLTNFRASKRAEANMEKCHIRFLSIPKRYTDLRRALEGDPKVAPGWRAQALHAMSGTQMTLVLIGRLALFWRVDLQK